MAEIKGKKSQLQEPNSVRYLPSGGMIAVVNASSNTITFYRYKRERYDQKPYQVIQNTQDVLWRPNGVDISNDCNFLAITSRKTHAVLIYQRVPHSADTYTDYPIQILQGSESNLVDTHSLCFHPNNRCLVVSNSWGGNNINIFNPASNDLLYYEDKPIITIDIKEMYDASTIHLIKTLPEGEGGCKGVAFSSDGKAIAITQNLSTELPGVTNSTEALLIFPIETRLTH